MNDYCLLPCIFTCVGKGIEGKIFVFKMKSSAVRIMIGVCIKIETHFGMTVSSIEKNVIGETFDSALIGYLGNYWLRKIVFFLVFNNSLSKTNISAFLAQHYCCLL